MEAIYVVSSPGWPRLAACLVVLAVGMGPLAAIPRSPPLLDYEINLSDVNRVNARPWTGHTVDAIRLSSSATVHALLRPREADPGAVRLDIYSRARDGRLVAIDRSASFRSEGTIDVSIPVTSLCAGACERAELWFIVARPDVSVSEDALSTSSERRRVLHATVFME